eukprot:jgi/Pico_ML_1/54883/g739.t1
MQDEEQEGRNLEEIKEHVQRLVDPLVDEFVWYREAPTFASQPSTTDVPAHIAGHVCYGDSVVDEWFVVFLMQVITERFPGLVAQEGKHTPNPWRSFQRSTASYTKARSREPRKRDIDDMKAVDRASSEQDTHWQVLCRGLRPAAFDPDASEVLEQEDGKVRELFAKYRETEEYRRFLHHCEQACAVLSESTRAEHAMDDGLFGSRGELFDDDDGWLDSGEPTIRSTLDRLEKAQDSSRGSLHEVEDLAERMRDFFVGESTFQGAEVGGEFDSSTLDPDAFIAQMREALGFEGPSESDASDSEGSDVDRRRRHGNDPGSVGPTYREVSGDEVDSDDEEDAFYLAYDARLREELRLEGPSVRPRADQDASFAKDAQGKVSEEHEEEGSSPTRERDFDMSVVENFLASYAAQEGLPGPVSNFAGLFDIAVPGPEVDPSEDPT